jgi:cobalt-zinc-cadmium resistance protein CzcA
MFEPMAMTVIIALVAAFVLSLTFVPAMIAIFVSGNVEEKENPVIRGIKSAYAPWLTRSMQRPLVISGLAAGAFLGSLLLFRSLGQEFIPTLDEKDIAMHAMRIPSTGITQSQTMQSQVEKLVSSVPEVAFVFSKTGTAEMASDPMPPNVSDTFIILKPHEEWPDAGKSKNQLIEEIQTAVKDAPGNNYEFTQPIQMRFNELISGVRSDVAVKLYGDDFAQLESTAKRIAQSLQSTQGAADVKIEQTSGLPFLEVTPRKDVIARYGLNVADVLDAVQIAIGGREAGLVFEGDRRFAIIVRLPEAVRQNQEAFGNLPILLPEADRVSGDDSLHPHPGFVPLRQLADITINEGANQISRENGKRRIVVQANVRNRDIGSFVAEAQANLAKNVALPPGYWLEWGGQFKNLEEAKARLAVVVPACFFMIFLLLFSALGSAKQALLVFSAVPLALSGGVVSLWLRDMPFSISAAVGFIALSGVAVLNGLVMISSFNQRVREGAALVCGCLRRCHEQGAACHDDSASGQSRICPDGISQWSRCGSTEAAGDGGDRRADNCNVAHAVVIAGFVPLDALERRKGLTVFRGGRLIWPPVFLEYIFTTLWPAE